MCRLHVCVCASMARALTFLFGGALAHHCAVSLREQRGRWVRGNPLRQHTHTKGRPTCVRAARAFNSFVIIIVVFCSRMTSTKVKKGRPHRARRVDHDVGDRKKDFWIACTHSSGWRTSELRWAWFVCYAVLLHTTVNICIRKYFDCDLIPYVCVKFIFEFYLIVSAQRFF